MLCHCSKKHTLSYFLVSHRKLFLGFLVDLERRFKTLSEKIQDSFRDITYNISEQSEDAPEPMQVDQATVGITLRKRKEKIPKHLKRGANDKEMDSFRNSILRIPIDKPFEEAYFTHML